VRKPRVQKDSFILAGSAACRGGSCWWEAARCCLAVPQPSGTGARRWKGSVTGGGKSLFLCLHKSNTGLELDFYRVVCAQRGAAAEPRGLRDAGRRCRSSLQCSDGALRWASRSTWALVLPCQRCPREAAEMVSSWELMPQ